MTAGTLLAVPNVSEGRDEEAIGAIRSAFDSVAGARVLDVHSDPDHNRSVYTIAGQPGTLVPALLAGAREVLSRVDLSRHAGVHPRVGALDVAPIVHLRSEDAGPACAEALVLGDRLGEELEVPVFLYGALGAGRSRADIRRGGPDELARRLAAGELRPDFGPRRLHPTAGSVLVGARPPLVAFNVELAPPATLQDATAIAAEIREGSPGGLTGVRALGMWLDRAGRAQVSMNVEDHVATPLAAVLAAVSKRAVPARAEIVGLPPRAALEGLPAELQLECAGTLEDALTPVRGDAQENH